MTVGNRFKVLKNQVMQCGVREVRRQKVVEQTVKCFQCEEEGHKKWECPKENKKRREEVAPPQNVWKKIKQHYGAKGLPPRGAVMSMEGWITQ